MIPAGGTLELVVPGDAGHSTWRKVGAIDNKQPRLASPDDPALSEGRPVFVVPAAAPGSDGKS